jgi:hypothetical protein
MLQISGPLFVTLMVVAQRYLLAEREVRELERDSHVAYDRSHALAGVTRSPSRARLFNQYQMSSPLSTLESP